MIGFIGATVTITLPISITYRNSQSVTASGSFRFLPGLRASWCSAVKNSCSHLELPWRTFVSRLTPYLVHTSTIEFLNSPGCLHLWLNSLHADRMYKCITPSRAVDSSVILCCHDGCQYPGNALFYTSVFVVAEMCLHLPPRQRCIHCYCCNGNMITESLSSNWRLALASIFRPSGVMLQYLVALIPRRYRSIKWFSFA
jgi:hypothetical protein